MKVHRFVSNDFSLRIAAVDATAVVAEMQTVLNAYPLATLGVGRAMVAALLMASQLKDGQEVGLLFKGNGPLGSVYAQASYEGNVRGYCPHPDYQAPNPQDAMILKKALGFGYLTVSRQQPFQKSPHYGTVDMQSGEIGDDVAHYLHQSHQIRSLVSLGVYLDEYGKVKAAGGVLLEVMPGVEESLVEKIQENADNQKQPVSEMILKGMKPSELVAPYLKGVPYTQIPHEHEVAYHCPCTLERVFRALGAMGLADIEDMIAQKEPAEIQCQMCGRSYSVTTEQLEELHESLRKGAMH